jgi:hypothetical protein
VTLGRTDVMREDSTASLGWSVAVFPTLIMSHANSSTASRTLAGRHSNSGGAVCWDVTCMSPQ